MKSSRTVKEFQTTAPDDGTFSKGLATFIFLEMGLAAPHAKRKSKLLIGNVFITHLEMKNSLCSAPISAGSYAQLTAQSELVLKVTYAIFFSKPPCP